MREDRIRQLIAREAARLMYEEEVGEYRDAKRKAARRYGPEKALSLGSHLPTNAEIHAELEHLISIHEEKIHPERLLAMRLLTLRYMELLQPFTPLLVGSVLSGAVTERSDIDLHLFADDPGDVEEFLTAEGIPFDYKLVTVRKGGAIRDYPHFYLEDEGIEIECTVYPRQDIRNAPKSSITGRSMDRANVRKVRKMIEEMLASKG